MRNTALGLGLALALASCSRGEPVPLPSTGRPAASGPSPVSTEPPHTMESPYSMEVPRGGGSADAPAPPPPAAPSAPRARNPSVQRAGERLAQAPPGPAPGVSGSSGPIDPGADAAWLRRLTTGEITEVTLNGGGTTLTLRVRFADGQKAVLKSEQRATGSNHRAEIAAYHLDRLLGLGRVAPVAGRPLSLRWLKERLAGDPATLERLEREVVARGDRVEGALIGWHTRPPLAADPPRGWESNPPTEGTPQEPWMAWSDMVLFDALIDNTDRWSGGNVMTLGPGGPVIFLDNASAFLGWRARQGAFLEKPLGRLCEFRDRTVQALRSAAPGGRLSPPLAASLSRDPLAPVLSPGVLEAMDGRYERVLRHIEGCKERPGGAAPPEGGGRGKEPLDSRTGREERAPTSSQVPP